MINTKRSRLVKLVTNKKFTDEARKSGASISKPNTSYKDFINMKPTNENEYYRFRMLWFEDKSNKRNIPFVEKYNHTVYGRDEDDKLTVDYVTCPTSPYLNIENAWRQCPICQYTNKQYNLLKETDWKNKSARDIFNKLKRRFVAFIPVYVIKDPHFKDNIGQIKILLIKDTTAYQELCDKIKSKEYEHSVFNAEKSIDLVVQIKEIPQKDNDGNVKINQKTNKPYMDRKTCFLFSKDPYDLNIDDSMIDALNFDDSIYTYDDVSTLEEFLSKYALGVDIPDNDIDFSALGETTKDDKKSGGEIELGLDNTVKDESPSDIDIGDIDLNIGDDEKKSLVSDEVDIDAIINDLDNSDLEIDNDDLPF